MYLVYNKYLTSKGYFVYHLPFPPLFPFFPFVFLATAFALDLGATALTLAFTATFKFYCFPPFLNTFLICFVFPTVLVSVTSAFT